MRVPVAGPALVHRFDQLVAIGRADPRIPQSGKKLSQIRVARFLGAGAELRRSFPGVIDFPAHGSPPWSDSVAGKPNIQSRDLFVFPVADICEVFRLMARFATGI